MQTWHWGFHSCNGLSADGDHDKWGGPYEVLHALCGLLILLLVCMLELTAYCYSDASFWAGSIDAIDSSAVLVIPCHDCTLSVPFGCLLVYMYAVMIVLSTALITQCVEH